LSDSLASQQKQAEIDFFDRHADRGDYNVFTPAASRKLIDAFVACTGLRPGAKVADLGCGSGAFTALLRERGYLAEGLDLSGKLISLARQSYPEIEFLVGDVEALPHVDGTLDGVLLSGVVHHLPNPRRCAAEVRRVLKPGGWFFAFDPNRKNPFMFLYRDRSSPFYSSVGVTDNERPVLARETVRVFSEAGLRASSSYLGGLHYTYVASKNVSYFLPIYNAIDSLISWPRILAPFRPFVLTYGQRLA
jgi:ubiquinone/menaquinone biosynthesis C-methylase UbiE